MAVIDLTNDPRVDMAMAQSIGNIFASVGKMEQNRQKRYKMDQVMTGINSGVDPMQAIQTANQTDAPRDKGLAGVWQGAGRLMGGAPRDLPVTDDAIERLLANNLSKRYQIKPMGENGYGNYDSTKGTLTRIEGATRPPRPPSTKKVVNSDSEYLRLNKVLDDYQDNMTPEAFNSINNQADAVGLRLNKVEDTSKYRESTQTDADGNKFRISEDGTRIEVPTQYSYKLEYDKAPSRESLGIKGGTKGEDTTPAPQVAQQPSSPATTSGEDLIPSGFTGFPTSHPSVKNDDGSKSNVLLGGYEINGKEYVIPTMVGGKKLTPKQAVAVARKNGLENYPSFDSVEAGEKFAQKYHSKFGEDGKLIDQPAPAEQSSTSGKTVTIQNEKGESEGKFTIPSGKTLFKKQDGSFVTVPDENIEGYMKANPGAIKYQIGD